MVGLRTRSAVQAYNRLHTNYGNPSVSFAASSPYTGEPRVQSLLMPVYFDCYANRSSNPSVTFGDSSPYTGAPRVVAFTHDTLNICMLNSSAEIEDQTYGFVIASPV